MEYEYDLYRITLVQALWRRRIAKRRAISLLRNIVQIQAVCRGFQARKKIDRLGGFPSEADTSPRLKRVVSQESSEGSTRQHSRDRSRKQAFEKARLQRRRQLQQEKRRAKAAPERPPPSAEEAGIQQVASIIIQTYWRSYFGRACYLQYIADVTLMQSVVRRCLAKRQTAKVKRGASNKIGRAPRHPHRDVTSSYGANFKKIESFESRNVSSMVPEGSVGSCNKKTNSVDDSVPSVPFKMLAEDDTDQPPSLTPPRKAREKSTGRSPSHFENANRFGGVRKAPWNSSGASGQYAVTSSGSYENGIVESQSDVSSGGWYNRNGARKISSDSYSVEKGKWDEKANQKPGDNQVSDQTSAVAKDIPRSKGWNVEEEIEKEATRNLIMAWKQKDKANTFTIKPRGGM